MRRASYCLKRFSDGMRSEYVRACARNPDSSGYLILVWRGVFDSSGGSSCRDEMSIETKRIKNQSSFRSGISDVCIPLLKELRFFVLRWFYKYFAPNGARSARGARPVERNSSARSACHPSVLISPGSSGPTWPGSRLLRKCSDRIPSRLLRVKEIGARRRMATGILSYPPNKIRRLA